VARDRRVATYRERAGKLNQRIDNFNLTVPISKLQWHRVRVDEEIEQFLRMLEDVPGSL